MKRLMVTGDEYNALTRTRRRYVYLQRAGVVSAIKRGARRRERRTAKTEIRRDADRVQP